MLQRVIVCSTVTFPGTATSFNDSTWGVMLYAVFVQRGLVLIHCHVMRVMQALLWPLQRLLTLSFFALVPTSRSLAR